MDLHVLYAEDEESIREPFVEMLGRRVKSVTAAKNGIEALELFSKQHFDLVITDIRMPMLSGLELAAEIRKTDRFTPIIVITAYEFRDFLLKAIEVGINKYLVKPVNKESLSSALEDIGKIVEFQRKFSDHKELINLIISDDNKVIVWAGVENIDKINNDFIEFFGFGSREDFYKLYPGPLDFFISNSSKTYRYNTETGIQWLDSFMKLNGIDRNTIINMSGVTDESDFYLNFQVFSNNTKIAFILKPAK